MADRFEVKRLMDDPAVKQDLSELESQLRIQATSKNRTPEERESAMHILWGLEALQAKINANNSTKEV
jgi:hypothetical protein